MVFFASPRATLRFRDATPVGGVRWFHEPGAWVERTPLRPADPPRATDPSTRFHARPRWND